MSGLLRRIKRSRTADAGDPPAAEQAAAPERAPTPADTSEAPAASAPAIQADPAKPAGLEPAEAAPRPAGRRGRLRRRLRYLRRARELMLRDLGGLVYEVHRSGGGDYGAHSNVIGGKVERLAGLDAEAGAIEDVLGARRPESVLFQPGVGGTCAVCGELYGSAARFCSSCGSAIDPVARALAAPGPEPAAPSEPRVVPPMPKPPAARAEDRPTRRLATGAAAVDEPADERAASAAASESQAASEPAAAAADEPTAAHDPAASAAAREPTAPDAPEAAAAAREPTAPDAPEAAAAAREPTAPDAPEAAARGDDAPTADAPTAVDEPGRTAEPGRNPFSGISNGRPEEKREPPELSSGDPLAARESRQ